MKKILLLAILIPLGGCFAGISTKHNYHFVSIPPSIAKDIKAQCEFSNVERNLYGGILEYQQNTSVLLKKIQEKQDTQYKQIITNLQAENAKLKMENSKRGIK